MIANRSYPAQMKAVFLDEDHNLKVKETKTPDPGPGEVVIKISAAPVNPSDIVRIRKASAQDTNHFIPGIEGSGTVIAAGKGFLPWLWLGKRVACSSKYSTSGTWAEYMVIPANMCFPLNKKVSDEQGAMTLVNPLTALAFIEIVKQGRHKALINNAASSALGRMLELLGKKNNIPVINIVRDIKKADILKETGSNYVLNSSDPSFIEDLATLSKELNATIFFDTVCSDRLPEIIEALPEGSSVVIYGNRTESDRIMVNPESLILKNVKISGFYLGNYAKENSTYRNMLNLRKVGNLMSNDLKITIRNRFPLENVRQALDTYLENMSLGKILLIP